VLTSDVIPFDALPALDAAVADSELVEYIASAGVIEQIIFGIDPSATFEATHTLWFADSRVRQAVTQCIDRQALADTFTGGRSPVMDTFVPTDHALRPADLPQWPYDPAAANTLLDEAGLLDANGDGVREAIGATQPFSVTLGTVAGDPLRQELNERVRDDLADVRHPGQPLYDGRRHVVCSGAERHRLRPPVRPGPIRLAQSHSP
jgi:ABC-type transport system substrate-binding protein